MKRALFKCCNLIGDALFASPILQQWHEKNPDFEIDLLTLPDHVAEVYRHFGVPLNVLFDADSSKYDFYHNFDIGKAFSLGDAKKLHAVEAVGQILFGPDYIAPTLKPIFIPDEEEHEKDLILISPFSRSCSSNQKDSLGRSNPPNKMIQWPHWLQIVTLLRAYGSIGVLGGKDDHCPLPIAEDEYYLNLSLNHVALLLRDCRMFVTIDNGMAHLASSQTTPTIEFYPACLAVRWAAPLGNPNLYIAQVDPANISVPQALYVVRSGIEALFLRRKKDEKIWQEEVR